MKKLLICLALLLAVLLLPAKLAQELENADNLSVGDRFRLILRADVALRQVEVPDTLSAFHVVKLEHLDKGKSRDRFQLTIVPLLPGSHSFPSLRVVAADGQNLVTDRFRISVIPVRAETDTLLVDLKPLDRYPAQLPLWAYVLLIAAMFGAMALAYMFWRRQPDLEPGPSRANPLAIAVPDPLWKTALRELDELIAQDLISRGRYVQHHYRLSLIQRKFMERKFHFPALEMTTSEIRMALDKIRLDKSEEIFSYQSYCDRVKFSKYVPKVEEVYGAETWLREWLLTFQISEAKQLISDGGGSAALR